jgi:tetratricopeptide (TPR) repeat protein
MRLTRVIAMLLAVEILFLGGSAYYQLVFPVRVLHHIVITVFLAFWLVLRLRSGQGLPRTPLNYPVFAAVGVWVLSAALSADPRMAFENLWFQFTHLIFFWIFADFIQRRRQRLLFEVQFIAAWLVLMLSSLELASWYFGLGIIPGTSISWAATTVIPLTAPRLALALNVSTLLAGYVAPLAVITLAWALTARRQYRPFLWILAVGLVIVLILTFSRGGLLSFAAALGTLLLLTVLNSTSLHGRFNQLTSGRMVGIGLLATGTAALVLIAVVVGSGSRTSGDQVRVDMWRASLDMAADYPVLGVGATQYGRAFREYRTPELARDRLASAHNAYLNTLAETGVVGLLVSGWLGYALLRAWWKQRQNATAGRRFRLDAAFAALVGLGVHSLTDVFTVTPVVLLMALLAAYCAVEPLSITIETPRARRLERMSAIVALLIVLAYGVWFIFMDTAQSRYQDSLRGGEDALANAQAAIDLDPGLRLYRLHLADLQARQAETPAEAASIYETALQLEPTWDTGWMTVAAYRESAGDLSSALATLDTARQINPLTPASLQWARLAEETNAAPDDEIVAAYHLYLQTTQTFNLPLSEYWQETPLRQQALDQYLAELPLDRRYRVLAAFDPQSASELVPSDPSTAAEWWIMGEAALQNGEAEAAVKAFDRAIQLHRTNGDYYVSRGEAKIELNDREGAERDLDLAQLLGTLDEYPNVIRAALINDPAEQEQLQIEALPPRRVPQEFAAVLYGRPATFDLPPAMRPPGPGHEAMQPWYEIAETAVQQGDISRARNVYRAILDYAPDETEAARLLAELNEH